MFLIYDFNRNLITVVVSKATENRVFCVIKSHPVMGFLRNYNHSSVVDVILDTKDGPS